MIENIVSFYFIAFTEQQRKREKRRFDRADVNTDSGLSRDELISMFHPEESPHMFGVIVEVRFATFFCFVCEDTLGQCCQNTPRIVQYCVT